MVLKKDVFAIELIYKRKNMAQRLTLHKKNVRREQETLSISRSRSSAKEGSFKCRLLQTRIPIFLVELPLHLIVKVVSVTAGIGLL